MMKTSMVLFAEFETDHSRERHTGGVWVTKPFQNWKKATEGMSLHTQASQACKSYQNRLSCAASTESKFARREKNRAAMKSLVRCTHFLTRHHIAHSTNFTQCVDLVMFCGAREFQVFVENASRNAIYTSRGGVVDFIEALGTREHGNMGTWEHGNMGTWEHGNTGTWEHGNTGTREHGNTGTREHGNTGTWEHGNTGRGVNFKKASKDIIFLCVSWQMSALISRHWRNCQFSVIGRKMALLLNAF